MFSTSQGKSKSEFHWELQRRLEENKRLYREHSPFVVFDSPFGKFVASHLGTNPWRVLIPVSFLFILMLRIVFGAHFSEFVLRILGGR